VEEEDIIPELHITLQPEEGVTTQPEEDTINLKMEKHCHKGEDSIDREVPQHQPLIQTMTKRASGALRTAGKSTVDYRPFN
jgi:hypothetical protein